MNLLLLLRRFPPTARLRERILMRLHAHRAMRYPTFDHALHASVIPETDYTRYAAVGVALRRIAEERIPGHLAEVGVYRGAMSRFIRAALPERRLYLFDTFEGFPAKDLEPAAGNDMRFRDTSVESVLCAIGDTAQVIVRKGRVPETFAGLEEERFAFVLLDLDIYAPTASSFDFFYPRLSPGGYLLVHDYNSPESGNACKRAFDAFLSDKEERLIELPDVAGTALIRKAGRVF